MIIPEPNLAYRSLRRSDVEGFERLLRLSIEKREDVLSAQRPVTPAGIEPASLEDLARITSEATGGSHRLEIYTNEGFSGLSLPWELYEPLAGDIYVFGPRAQLTVQLTERRGHNTYAPVEARTTAQSNAPLGFLYKLSDSLYETVRGDAVIIAKEGRVQRIAQAAVRPQRNRMRSLN